MAITTVHRGDVASSSSGPRMATRLGRRSRRIRLCRERPRVGRGERGRPRLAMSLWCRRGRRRWSGPTRCRRRPRCRSTRPNCTMRQRTTSPRSPPTWAVESMSPCRRRSATAARPRCSSTRRRVGAAVGDRQQGTRWLCPTAARIDEHPVRDARIGADDRRARRCRPERLAPSDPGRLRRLPELDGRAAMGDRLRFTGWHGGGRPGSGMPRRSPSVPMRSSSPTPVTSRPSGSITSSTPLPTRRAPAASRCSASSSGEHRVRLLAEQAEEVDLVVVGARGHGAVGAALLGSVSTWLLHHVHRPIAVVPMTRTRAAFAAARRFQRHRVGI
jgi:hypothetical protein